MASTTVERLSTGENNNPEKIVGGDHPEERNPTDSVPTGTTTDSVPTGTTDSAQACAEETEQPPVAVQLESSTEETKPTSEETNSTSAECDTTSDMGNRHDTDNVAEIKPVGEIVDNVEPSEKVLKEGVKKSDKMPVSSQSLPENLSQAASEQTSPEKAQPSSPNQKGRNVQFANDGRSSSETGCGPVVSSDSDMFSVDRPFVSTLGGQPVSNSQTVQPAVNGVPEDDGFRLRHHGRSYSERGSGMLRTRASSVIVNGTDDSTELEVRRRSGSVLEVKEQAYTRLKEELHSAQLELQLKDKECEKLSRIQNQMEKELEELTASLFEEANNMVQEANIKRMHTEKLLRESNSKIEVLEAEVSALKTLVITSTPSMPNRHLHPQIDTKTTKSAEKFVKSHKRSTSHHDFKKDMETLQVVTIDPDIDPRQKNDENREIDPVYYQEFKTWKTHPGLDASHAFLQRIIHEDILPCLNFANQELSQDVFDSVRNNVLTIELIPGKNSFPRRCALLDTTKLCQYRIRLRDTGPWHFISQFARNRIATVCDFYTYMRYIQQGLVKSDESNIYWEIIRLRKQMAMARLGVMS